jgi:hypothetical protein
LPCPRERILFYRWNITVLPSLVRAAKILGYDGSLIKAFKQERIFIVPHVCTWCDRELQLLPFI